MGTHAFAQRAHPPVHEDATKYGGRFSMGVAIGGGGILGVPLRIYPTPTFAVEVGGYFRPFITINDNYFTIDPGVMLAGGFIIYPNVSVPKPSVAKMSGFSLKGGHSFSKVPESFGSIAWAMERTKWAGNNFGIEIGGGALILSKQPYHEYSITESRVRPMLYFKVQVGMVFAKRDD